MGHEERGHEPRDDEREEGADQQIGDAGDAEPAGGGDRDEEAIEKGREKLDQAGGGH